MKITRKNARRLAKFLEEELGWQVFSAERACKNWHVVVLLRDDDRFCPKCGVPLSWSKSDEEPIVDELVGALKYALEAK